MRREYIDALKKTLLFGHYSNEELMEVLEIIDYRISQYKKNSLVFIENETCTTFNIILTGAIQIKKIDSFGRTLTIAAFGAGETLGENLLFGAQNTYPMTGQAKLDTTILQIPKETILQLCQKDSIFLTQLLRVLCDKTVAISGKLKNVTLKSIRQGISEYIFEEYRKQNSLTISLNMTKKAWAEIMGIQRPSLSRELIKMKKEGLIDYDLKTISIRKLSEIKKYVTDI